MTCTPVSTGRLSSLAAAKTTCSIASRSALGSRRMTWASLIVGMGGKSSASMPLIVASLRAQTIWARFDPAATLSVIGALGSEATNSVSSREGIVIAPSSSTLAVIQS